VVDAFPDGAGWVELASLSDPGFVPRAVADALGVREGETEALTDILVRELKPRRLLLVLDNCEHLLAACTSLVDTLLRGCPDIRVVATSREPLSIHGETTYRVPPLPSAEAVQLFVERAMAAMPSFSLTDASNGVVTEICRRLDGIPLAIEMAAVRLRTLSIETLASRLDDRFRLLTDGNRAALPRHRTLRAMIDWSHDLLSEPERMLLRRLAVFAGGWTPEAAEAVGSGGGTRAAGRGSGR
jgi:predicted ATPase